MISLFFKSTISKKNDILIPFRVDRMIQLLLMYFKYVLEKFYSHTKSPLSIHFESVLNIQKLYSLNSNSIFKKRERIHNSLNLVLSEKIVIYIMKHFK